jgi:hypothetical protein
MKKIIITLNIGNYQPAIRSLTYPLMTEYARKIRSDFAEIKERKHPEWPIVMEKFQMAEMAKGYDWSIFVDADALINPELFDITAELTKDQVCFNGKDISTIRSYPDIYFMRDNRRIGACDWLCASSDWTRDDLYHFPEGTLEDYLPNIYPTIAEKQSGCFKDHHLIDDYMLSRNIARFGLHHDTIIDICGRRGMKTPDGRPFSPWLFHLYNIPEGEKINRMLDHLSKPAEQGGWNLMKPKEVMAFREQWLNGKAAA